MTIFIEGYVKQGYCKWQDGKIVVSATCPAAVRRELEDIDCLWLEQHPDAGHLVVDG